MFSKGDYVVHTGRHNIRYGVVLYVDGHCVYGHWGDSLTEAKEKTGAPTWNPLKNTCLYGTHYTRSGITRLYSKYGV